MRKISFEYWKQNALFHNPLKNGDLDLQEIQVRLDPLTGHQSILNSGLEQKSTVMFPQTDHDYLASRAEETRQQCFLCDEKWRLTTPKYDSRLVAEGRLVKGEAVLCPNLFPLAAYHAVVMLGKAHFRKLDEFSPDLLRDALSVSIEFIRRCYEADSHIRHFSINANYLFPAGSSVLHPHLQLLGSPFPSTHEALIQKLSIEYHGRNGSSYWQDLAQTEKETGERWLGNIGESCWFTAYSPVGVHEINAVWPNVSHFLQWDDSDVSAMAEGISRILRAYHAMKCSTFNFSCFSGPVDSGNPDFRCFLRIINRQNVTPNYRTDDFYFQKLLKNEIIFQAPERLAAFVRGYF